MKKLLIALGISGMIFSTVYAASVSSSDPAVSAAGDWTKAKDGTWPGKNKTWYKVNTKDATLWTSTNGKDWTKSENGMWQDKEGKWLQIKDMKLVWSADGGKTWGEVPEWKWEAEDGKWYKFDNKWTLWVM